MGTACAKVLGWRIWRTAKEGNVMRKKLEVGRLIASQLVGPLRRSGLDSVSKRKVLSSNRK